MSPLIRLVYASRSTFARSAQHQGLDPGVARILARSRKNNAQRQVVGGLLFGDGCFLQCLEGETNAVETLYEKIATDRRHRDVQVLLRRKISQRAFGAWSMKYVPGERALRDALGAWGLTSFDPYSLTAEQLEAAVEFMQQEADAVNTIPGEFDDEPAQQPGQGKANRIVSQLKPSPDVSAARSKASRQRAGGMRLGPILVAVIALALGAVAYWQLGLG